MQHDQRRIASPRIRKVVDMIRDPNSVARLEMVEHRRSPKKQSSEHRIATVRCDGMLPNFLERCNRGRTTLTISSVLARNSTDCYEPMKQKSPPVLHWWIAAATGGRSEQMECSDVLASSHGWHVVFSAPS